MESNFLSEKVISYLLLNSSFISNSGLFHGKMGIVLFFSHYARFTKQPIYDDFAGELLDEIYDNISANTLVDFENGLCGIGWGIEYLLRNGFMEGDSDDILKEIDNKIMERDPRRIMDLSFRKGLGGIMYYILARLTSFRKKQEFPFDNQYLMDIYRVVSDADFEIDSILLNNIRRDFISVFSGKNRENYTLEIPTMLLDVNFDVNKEMTLLPLGLCNGITTLCLNELLEK